LHLADLAVRCNTFLQNQDFEWHYGGDGPVFGIHVTDSVPHLRAHVHYGPNVLDEWMGIHFLREITKLDKDVAAMAWDVQDGQVLLIQLADLLPESFDQDSTDRHKYACWLWNGSLILFETPHISLPAALSSLRQVPKDQAPSYPRLQEALQYWLDLNQQEAKMLQRTALVLPRNVALLVERRPDLLHTAIQAFCSHLEHANTRPPSSGSPGDAGDDIDLMEYEDWVWTTPKISRTNYAMVRTMTSEQWDNPDSSPIAIPVEVKRMQRTCRMDSAKHTKHAVAIGIRVMAGFHVLLQNINLKGILSSQPLSSLQDRVLFWNRIEQEVSGSHAIIESYHQGPNQSMLDLESVLKCPVFPEERNNLTLLTAPESSLTHQIRQGLKQSFNEVVSKTISSVPPKPDQVDSDEWMDVLMAKHANDGTEIQSTDDLDSLLSKFQNFLQQKSDFGGVDTRNNNDSSENTSPVKIRPRVFMNILHAVLKGDELVFPVVNSGAKDPFFYDEDYDELMEGNEEGDYDETAPSIHDMMTAMDHELAGHRNQEQSAEQAFTENRYEDDPTMEVLSNLLQSLEASGGGSGPVVNILKEMDDRE
jgi:SGT1 protein